LDPKQEFLKLTNNSEVIVAPKVRKQAAAEEEQRLEAAPKKIVPCVSARVLPSTHDTLDVHVHPDTVDALRDKDGELPRQIRLSKLQPVSLVSRSKNNEDDNQEQQHDEFEKKEDLVSKALYANLVVSKDIPLKHVQLGSVVRSTLELKDFDIVK
jgi:peroxin-1